MANFISGVFEQKNAALQKKEVPCHLLINNLIVVY